MLRAPSGVGLTSKKFLIQIIKSTYQEPMKVRTLKFCSV